MISFPVSPSPRIKGAIGAALVQILLGYALVMGLAVHLTATASDDLKLFGVAPAPPPPPAEKPRPRPVTSARAEGAASPPNLRAKATEVVAPPSIVPPMAPSPVIAAPIAGIGNAASAGAADIRGPGTGSGGQGNGTGSGGAGDGDGDGGETPPRWVKGRIKDSDYPRGAGEAGVSGTVAVRYIVGIDGRVSGCAVTKSSGHPELDDTTCRLIEQRFRFKPSRDADGTPVPSVIVEDHTWEVRHEEPPATP